MIKPIRALAPEYLIEGLIPYQGTTLITGHNNLQRLAFIYDLMFSFSYSGQFHGRGISRKVDMNRFFFVGDALRLSNFLWAWNQDRKQPKETSYIEHVSARSVKELDAFIEEQHNGSALASIVFIESLVHLDPIPNGWELTALADRWISEFGVTLVLGFDASDCDASTRVKYHFDTHIDLSTDNKEQLLLVNVIKNKYNDYPLKFALAKKAVGGILILCDSDAFNEAQTVLYEFKNSTIKQKIRIIDALTALTQTPNWPTYSAYGKILNTTAEYGKLIMSKLQNSGYIDTEFNKITEKGSQALRNAKVI